MGVNCTGLLIPSPAATGGEGFVLGEGGEGHEWGAAVCSVTSGEQQLPTAIVYTGCSSEW